MCKFGVINSQSGRNLDRNRDHESLLSITDDRSDVHFVESMLVIPSLLSTCVTISSSSTKQDIHVYSEVVLNDATLFASAPN